MRDENTAPETAEPAVTRAQVEKLAEATIQTMLQQMSAAAELNALRSLVAALVIASVEGRDVVDVMNTMSPDATRERADEIIGGIEVTSRNTNVGSPSYERALQEEGLTAEAAIDAS